MPIAYSECRKNKRKYLVYTSSSRYNNYNCYNAVYDIRITEAE
jgi:hypothetical protein